MPAPTRRKQLGVLGWLLLGPVVLGALSGVAAAWTSTGYWLLQLLGVAGALGTTPHRPVPRSLAVGATCALAFALSVLSALMLTGRESQVDLGDRVAWVLVVTLVAGPLLTLAGSAISRRRQPAPSVPV